jgi:hypothetical protein
VNDGEGGKELMGLLEGILGMNDSCKGARPSIASSEWLIR